MNHRDIELFADDLEEIKEQLYVEFVNEQFETHEVEDAQIRD